VITISSSILLFGPGEVFSSIYGRIVVGPKARTGAQLYYQCPLLFLIGSP
jgi:hypothetical protein